MAILCPAGAFSGGPEALHQLAEALAARGADVNTGKHGSFDRAGRKELTFGTIQCCGRYLRGLHHCMRWP